MDERGFRSQQAGTRIGLHFVLRGRKSQGGFRREGRESQKPIARTQNWFHRVVPNLGPGLGGGRTKELQDKWDRQGEGELEGESKGE